MKCERCGKETAATTMSYFDTQEICIACDDEERAHPKFKEARRADEAAIRRGDFNFTGIGTPE